MTCDENLSLKKSLKLDEEGGKLALWIFVCIFS